MMPNEKDVAVLRELASRVAEMAADAMMDERRELWRAHNSLERTRPLVLSLGMPWWPEAFDNATLRCEDPLFRRHELAMQQTIHQGMIGDDTVIEPWVTVQAVYEWPTDSDHRWGPKIGWIDSGEARGAKMFDPPLLAEPDFEKLIAPRHAIDEAATERDFDRIAEAVGDIITVNLDRR